MDVTVHTRHRMDAGLIHRWNTLHARCEASIFLTPQWSRAWIETIGRDADPLVFEVFIDGDSVAILPACTRRSRGVVWLELIGAAQSAGDHLDLLALAKFENAAIEALLGHFENSPNGFDGLWLANLRANSRFATKLLDWSSRRGFVGLENNRQQLPFIDLPDSFDAYLQTLSSNMRYHIRRRKREADRAGAKMRKVRSPDEVALLIDEFLNLHQSRWQRDGKPGAFDGREKRRFLELFCKQAAQLGWLRGYVLDHNGQSLGALIAFHLQRRGYFYQMGWTASKAVASPGALLLSDAIEQAVAEKLTVFDFLQGSEPYKSRWAASCATQRTVIIGLRRTARLAATAVGLKESCKSFAGALGGVSRKNRALRREPVARETRQ